jgi:hypothetical protein
MFRKIFLTLTLFAALALPMTTLAQETPITDVPLVDWMVELWADIAAEAELAVADSSLDAAIIEAHTTLPTGDVTPLTEMLLAWDSDYTALFVNGLHAVVRYALPVLNDVDMALLLQNLETTDLTLE